jgi:hypothetical protein
MNNLRSTLLVAVTAFVAAACGDKVTVAGPTSSTATVKTVSVAPSTATLNIGDQITLTAAVTADAGLATTVTWKSSDASKASVDASGNVKGLAATPGVAICATSTVDSGKVGCASVIVTGNVAIVPATISIASITTAGNLNAPVNPAAVVGTIDVKLNIAPGNQTPSRVDLLVGSTVVASQGFTATQAAALRSAADEAVAAQSAFPSVVLSFNTAAYNAITGVPSWVNGTFTIGAKLYTVQGGSTAAAANATQTLTFTNADGFVMNTTTYTSNTANDATGYRWSRIVDSTAYTLLPVAYSGKTATAVTLRPFCGTATTNINVAAAPFRYVVTAANAATYQTTNGAGICSATAQTTTGEQPSIAGATYSDGSAYNAGAYTILNLATTPSYRWDHVAPIAVAGSTLFGSNVNIRINVNPNGRANGWVNDAVAFNAGATKATSNNFLCDASAAGFNTCVATDSLPRDGGVGGIVYSVQVGATKAAAYTAAALTNATTLSPSLTNTTYCAIAFASDALGNKTTLTAAQQATACGTEANNKLIGVDRAAPTIKYSGGIASNARIGTGTVASNFSVIVNDTGLVGNSGMLPTAPVRMMLSRRAAGAANSAGTTTLLSADTSVVVTAVSGTGVVSAGGGIYTTAISTYGGLPMTAYWTHNATAFDAAGNSASIATPSVMVYDPTAPLIGAPSVPTTVSAIGYNATALVSEDLDVQDVFANVTYVGAPTFTAPTIQIAPTTLVNGYNAATFINTNSPISQVINLPLAIQANMAAGLSNVSGITMTVRSQSNLAATSGSTAPAAVVPGAAILFPNMTSYPAAALPAGVTGVVTGNTTVAAAATPATTTLTANFNGTTAIFNNPFSRVDFYMVDITGTKYFLVGSSSTAVLNDNGAVRTFSYSASVTGSTLYTLLGGAGATFGSNIVAVAVNASGTIGMVSAANTALNIVF